MHKMIKQGGIFVLFYKRLTSFYSFTCVNVLSMNRYHVYHVPAVPTEARRGQQSDSCALPRGCS